MAIGMRGGTSGIPTWMAFRRQLEVLPSYANRPATFRGLRIPRPPPELEGDTPAGLLCWGSTGELPSPTPLPTVSVNIKWPDEFWTEKWRDSQLVRIENPDDPSQYIMDNRPKTVDFEKRSHGATAGSNTSAEVPPGIRPGMSNYENTDRFVDSLGVERTKVRMHYLPGHGETSTPVPP